MTGRRTSRGRWSVLGALALALMLLGLAPSATLAANQRVTGVYSNPLKPQVPNDGIVESCADPSTFYDNQSQLWYTYCTADPLNDEDKNAAGAFNFHLIPILSSADLINWTYRGDAFTTRPAYATPDAGIWAPEIEYYPEATSGKYHLLYTVTNTTGPGGGSAIGVATSDSPIGPWTHSATPAVEPHGADCCGPDSRRWVFDPEVLRTDGPDYIYYGSYFGGVSVRQLSEDGLTSDPATQSNVAIANKYEGPEVVFKNGFYYLFVSATDCCRGPLTAYTVFAGRSASPAGPFVDREGVDLNDNEDPIVDPTDARAGGTPVISMNGNRWIGTGHNTVFKDFDGQWWTIYHAVDRNEPYFVGAVGFTKRPALLDPIDWAGGWPTVRGGLWASDEPMPAPAAQPGDKTKYHEKDVKDIKIGRQLDTYSDNFNGGTLGAQWSWVRQPAPGTFGLENKTFRFDTQAADLFEGSNSASVLLENAPAGNYVVETKFKLNLPPEGCCFNFVQAGLVIYGDDDNFIKLAHASIFNTRQTEFAKELFPVPTGYPRYGNTVVGPPAEWTYLRIAKRDNAGQQEYTAYTKQDGKRWVRGGTWTHQLGERARIGLVSMGGSGFVANFDYVRVYKLNR